MNLHEYQSHKLLREFGLNCVKGSVANSTDEAHRIAQAYFDFAGDAGCDLVVKAQVLCGGRGKGAFSNSYKSGIHLCHSADEVANVAKKMLGQRLITIQSGPEGKPVNLVYLCERKYIRRETYISFMMDRDAQGPIVIASAVGGVNIEILAVESPEQIIKEAIDTQKGVTDEQASKIATKLGFKRGKLHSQACRQIKLLYDMFWQNDCTLLEINPFAETSEGEVLCMDAKINIDPNSLFRHPELASQRDFTQDDARDVQAAEHDLNYIGLDGNIACLVNGAGLAMATMDIIKLHGGKPANFLDVGGGASERQVMEAFRLITSDKKVKSILVNIFGGIMRCDIIAQGIVNAAKMLGLNIPVVIRLQGTNAAKASEIIEGSGLRLIAENDLDDAAEQAVKVAEIMNLASQSGLKVNFELPI